MILSFLVEFTENIFVNLGLIVILAMVGGRLANYFKLPNVTGYIVVGALTGPHVLHLVTSEFVESLDIISSIAIGFIGYTIGLEIKFKKLRDTGKEVLIITFAQAFVTAIIVALGIGLILLLVGNSLQKEYAWTYALVLGAIATATAPAAVVALVKSYRTKGPVTNTLLPLVAFDDAIGIMLFAILLNIAISLVGGSLTIQSVLIQPLIEIILSLGVGALIGYGLTVILKRSRREDNSFLTILIVSVIFFSIGLAELIDASAILLPMSIGIVVSNFLNEKYEHRLTENTDFWIAPYLLLFFTIAGLSLDFSALATSGAIAFVYVILRIIGKVSGAHLGAIIMKSDKNIKKFLGWTLLPQAGVAINMATETRHSFFDLAESLGTEMASTVEQIGLSIESIALASTVVFALIGVILAKFALQRSGEVDQANEGWGIPK